MNREYNDLSKKVFQVELSGLVSDQVMDIRMFPKMIFGDLQQIILYRIGDGYDLYGGAPPYRRKIMKIGYEFKFYIDDKEMRLEDFIPISTKFVKVIVHNRGNETPLVD